MPKKQTLADEAKDFIEKKKPARPNKTLTLRRYYAGMALAGFLGGGHGGSVPPEEIVNQSFLYADKMIEHD